MLGIQSQSIKSLYKRSFFSMKLLFLILLSFSSGAWHKLPEYPDVIYGIHGDMIESSRDPPISNHIELAYSPNKELCGVSFYNNEDEKFGINGVFNIRVCGIFASGIIDNVKIKFNDDINMHSIINCETPVFMRVSDGEESSVYKIEKRKL